MSKQLTNKEKRFNKLKTDFLTNNLTKDQLYRLPTDKKIEYLKRNISTKFKIPSISIKCESCAFTILYQDSGYISDEEFLNNSEISKKFKHT